MANKTPGPLRVEVVYARPESVWRRQLDLPQGATALQAIELSGVLQQCSELQSATLTLGIFGRVCAPHQVLAAGDRVEIYRPLVFDPMESRRRRQQHRQRRLAADKLRPGLPKKTRDTGEPKLSES